MSGKEKRRRLRKEKARRTRRQSQQAQGSARLLDQLHRSVDMLARYSDDGTDPEETTAAARSNLADLSGKVVEAACGLDVITAVASVQTTMAMRRSAMGEDLPAAVFELIALLLTCRDAAGPSETRRDEYLPDHLLATAWELLSVGNMIPVFESPDRSPESSIVLASILREVLLRNPVYPAHAAGDAVRFVRR